MTTDCVRNLLVVEDDISIRESLRYALEFEGYQVELASHGKEGLDRLAAMPKQPCAILLDLMMPVMDGWQFSRALTASKQYGNVPVVLITAYADRTDGATFKHVIKKPFDLDALLTMIKKLCP